MSTAGTVNFRYRFLRSGPLVRIMTNPPSAYDSWTREQLIQRLVQLDDSPKSPTTTTTSTKNAVKPFSFTSYTRRKIALKFCYSGWEYNGLAHQLGPTPLPTVEGVLFDALAQARLVDPEGGFDACGFERCGRTDRGVSAAGQVVSLYVRSALKDENIPAQKTQTQIDAEEEESPAGRVVSAHARSALKGDSIPAQTQTQVNAEKEESPVAVGVADRVVSLHVGSALKDDSSANVPAQVVEEEESHPSRLLEGEFGLFDDDDDDDDLNQTSNTSISSTKQTSELNYLAILNRLLPPTIRILAWSPVAPTFSARFNCSYRHYKYVFSAQRLDIQRMREGAARLIGEHDFRNLCKLDPAKQITSFKRKILRADISPLNSNSNEYVFDLIGTAFLYHQVRHIMAVLFLVGMRLEDPSVVTALLNVSPGAEGDDVDDVVDRKPEYQMADGLPLMLWDCAYADGDVNWRTGTDDSNPTTGAGDTTTLHHELSTILERSTTHNILDQHFLAAAERYHHPANEINTNTPTIIPLGGGTYKRITKYIPLLERKRLESVEVVNERWRAGKGARREARKGGE